MILVRSLVGLMLAILLAAGFAAPASAKSTVDFPETTLCPDEYGDLDYALYATMRAADFEEDVDGGYRSFRREATTLRDVASLDMVRWLRVTFVTFDTSRGTKLVAEMRYVTPTRIWEVDDPKIAHIFQSTLDKMSVEFPCA